MKESVGYLQVVVLSLLLSFQVQTSQSSQVLLTNGLVHGGSATDSLPVVVAVLVHQSALAFT